MIRTTIRGMIKTFILLTLMVGTMTMGKISCTVLKTAANLVVLNDNIQVYNEQLYKTDEMTEEAERWIKERQEKFFNSQQTIVRIYSTSNGLVKLVMILWSLLTFIAICMMWLSIIMEIDRKGKRSHYKRSKGIA